MFAFAKPKILLNYPSHLLLKKLLKLLFLKEKLLVSLPERRGESEKYVWLSRSFGIKLSLMKSSRSAFKLCTFKNSSLLEPLALSFSFLMGYKFAPGELKND